jgi:hypothetical protein
MLLLLLLPQILRCLAVVIICDCKQSCLILCTISLLLLQKSLACPQESLPVWQSELPLEITGEWSAVGSKAFKACSEQLKI